MGTLLARIPRPLFPQFTFLFDNLKSHFSDTVYNMVYAAGHRMLPRPAYSPSDGPIEYIFNIVEQALQKDMYLIRTEDDLLRHTNQIVANIDANTIDNTFIHCGYL